MVEPGATASHTTSRPELRIDGQRLLDRLSALAEIGAIEGGGCARLALSDEDRAARDLVVSWMRDSDLEVRIDAIGNVIGTWNPPGRPAASAAPPILMGSHIDTVRTGGRYDGNLGVLAGIEVIQTVAESGFRPERGLAVAFFTNEEGARFSPDMMGSLTYVGGLPLEEALDIRGIDGATVGDELLRIGYVGPHPCPGPAPHAYVELHIEQGPVLEAEGVDVGVVEGVQGISWQEVTIVGQANHAGTTPMALRHDAGFAAAAVATYVRTLAARLGPPQVATVGSLQLHPGLVNVVAAGASLTVDLRNTDDDVLTRAEGGLATFLADLATAEGVTISSRALARFSPVTFARDVVDLVEATARRLGHSTRRLPSGAGHDAQMFARVCPSGMIFVPSVGGVSHNPAEHTEPEQLVAGADVLLQVVLALATEEVSA
jgi:N-carbamoyl-L-amino-acid hydrolase